MMGLGLNLGLAQRGGGGVVLRDPSYTVQTLVDDANLPATVSYTPTAGTVNAVFIAWVRYAANPTLTVGGVEAVKILQTGADSLANSTPDSEVAVCLHAWIAPISGTSARDVALTFPDIIEDGTQFTRNEVIVLDVAGLTINSVAINTDAALLPTFPIGSPSVSVGPDIAWAEKDLVIDITGGSEAAPTPSAGWTDAHTFSNGFGSIEGRVRTLIPASAASGQTRSLTDSSPRYINLANIVLSADSTAAIRWIPKRFRHVYGLESGSTSRSITFEGVYYGSPAGVQVRVMNADDDTEAVTWATATASGGAWSVTMTVPRTTHEYYLQMRETGSSVEYTDKTPFSVGYIVAQYGQSQMARYLFEDYATPVDWSDARPRGLEAGIAQAIPEGPYTTPSHPGGRKFHTAMANICPVTTINGAIGGTTIAQLSKPGGFYTDLLAYLTDLGEPVSHILWSHGEFNARTISDPADIASYPLTLETLRSDLESDLGQSAGSLKMHVCGLSRTTNTSYDTDFWADVNDALIAAADTYPNIYYSHSKIDGDLNGDGTHFTGEYYETDAERFAHNLQVVEGDETTAAVFTIASAASVSGTSTTVTVTHGLGTDFTPTTGIAGFEVSNDGSTWVSATGVRTNATTITLTHADITAATHVRYMYGTNPTGDGASGVAANIVIDNGALSMPLRPVSSRAVT